jgi:hypothetical protein
MGPTPGAEPVATRKEIRLQDRLQHQFQGCLDYPVAHGGDPKASGLAVRLRDQPLPHRQWTKAAVLQRGSQPSEENLDPDHGLHVVGGAPIHAGCLGTLVVPHPIPRDQKERGIGDKVEQIVKPAMGVITGPTVQLRLDLQYPMLRLIKRRRPARRYSPTSSWHSTISSANLLVPFAMYAPLARSDYYETSAPPDGPQPATDLPLDQAGCLAVGRPRMVPTFTVSSIDQIGAQLYPGSLATPTP